MPSEVRIVADVNVIARRAAEEFLQCANSAVSERGSFGVALSGGSTPKALYNLLATDPMFRSTVPWDKVRIYFGDERSVGPDRPDSNFRMANESLLSKVPLRQAQIFRIKAECGAEQAAQEYETTVCTSFAQAGSKIGEGQFPRFDLVLLGIGNEGHTASLFPGTKALHEARRIVVRNWVGKLFTERITLTAPSINSAASVLFMAAGADKALALKGILEGPYEPEQLPAQMIQPKGGKLLWLVDKAAGGMLSIGIRE